MNQEQLLKALKYLGTAYNKEFTQEQASVWFDLFKDDDYKTFSQAIKRLISTKQFIPSISEIKQEMALINTPSLQLDPDEEWETVLIAIRKYGYYKPIEALATLKPLTKHIVKIIGWGRLCSSESIQWERKEFIELFKNKKDNAEEVAMLSEPTMTLAELTRKAQEHLQIEKNEQKLIN